MRFEKTSSRESLDASVARVAAAYGFSNSPVALSKKSVSDQGDDYATNVQVALVKSQQPAKKPTQVWGAARKPSGTTLSFTVLASRHAISHALVVKTALSVAEIAGYSDLVVGVSSIGDHESRRRFQRELASFFRKNAGMLSPELLKKSTQDPESAYREVLSEGGELADRLPRPIDFLSENSRKVMVDALHFFEEAGITYQLESHLPASVGVHAELLFAISGVNQKGERTVIATGGRLDELMKKQEKTPQGHAVGISLMVPESVEPAKPEGELSCFVVHIGEAAKLQAFTVTEALWRAHVAVQEALLSESLREQMDTAKQAGAKYIAIIGQRESLDKTVIVRNRETGMQQAMPVEKLAAYVSRGHR